MQSPQEAQQIEAKMPPRAIGGMRFYLLTGAALQPITIAANERPPRPVSVVARPSRRERRARERAARHAVWDARGDAERLATLTKWQKVSALGGNSIARIVGPAVGEIAATIAGNSRSKAVESDADKRARINAKYRGASQAGLVR